MAIFFGSNDSAENWQGVPLDRYKDNIRDLVQQALAENIRVVLVGVALHDEVNYTLQEGETKNCRNTTRNLKYNQAAREVAEEFNPPFVDLWHAFARSVGWSEGDEHVPGVLNGGSESSLPSISHLLPDSLHFSGEAYRIFYQELMGAIEKGYPDLIPDNLPTLLPHYSELADAQGDLDNVLFNRGPVI